jgi:crotonobetainyl-CoA:carnitine CoA-transferase CaiB-like acyl-CoA transferase
LCDPLAGLHAAFAAIAALEIRDRTGAGIHVESTMVEAALNVAAEPVLEYTRNGVELQREGNRGPGASPQGLYRCSGDDEWVALAIVHERAWSELAEVIGHSELAVDETLRDEWARRRRADEIDKLIEEWTVQRSPTDVVNTLRTRRIAVARVVGAADLLEDEQLKARGFWETIDHPVVGTFKTTGMPFTFAGGQRKWVTTPAPLYGQHTDEVLRDVLGYTPADIAALEEVGAVGRRPAGL